MATRLRLSPNNSPKTRRNGVVKRASGVWTAVEPAEATILGKQTSGVWRIDAMTGPARAPLTVNACIAITAEEAPRSGTPLPSVRRAGNAAATVHGRRIYRARCDLLNARARRLWRRPLRAQFPIE
jgi:hypothetical protein